MSLISIAQGETFHISFVQFANKGYGADLLTPESYPVIKCPSFLSLSLKRQKIERIVNFHTLYLTFHIKFLNSTNWKLT